MDVQVFKLNMLFFKKASETVTFNMTKQYVLFIHKV